MFLCSEHLFIYVCLWNKGWDNILEFILVPFQAVTRHHGDYSVMGTPSLQPFLKTYWLTPVNDWPIVAKHANMTSSRGSINAAPATIRQNLFLHLAEPRLWLKMLQLTVKVRSFEGRPHGCSSAAFR